MYSMLRPLLFALDPETSHDLCLDMLSAAERLKLIKLMKSKVVSSPKQVMGLTFDNPVGLAAGLDKNGDYFNALGALGFGFVEIGTITPKSQPGNTKPRLFRLNDEQAVINRMGFNNKGVDHLVEKVKRRRYNGILGINLGKNKITPEENALSDYVIGMEQVYAHADYITINISSPNTPGLRNLQYGDALKSLLSGIDDKRESLSQSHDRRVPIAVKIAPDNDNEALKSITDALMEFKMDAVIATNTTLSRDGVQNSEHKDEAGGLSGAPLAELSTETVATVKSLVGDDLPIIGVGGISSGDDAKAKIDAGADLVQVYSGFIYRGPELVGEISQSLR